MGDFVSDLGDNVLEPLGLVQGQDEKALNRNYAALNELKLPDVEKLKLYADPTKYVQQQGASGLANVKIDPRLLKAQFGALSKLSNIANTGGLTPEDRAQLDQITRQEAISEQGQRGSIMQNAAQRGVSGSGLELAQLLNAEQGTANRGSQRDLGVAALAQQRSLDAILNQANLAGEVRGQEYGQKSDAATAQDVINRFNTGNMNAAGMSKANALQNIGEYNANVPQLDYQNKLARLQGISAADLAKAQAKDANNVFGQQAKSAGDKFAKSFGSTLGSGVAGGM